MIEFTDLPFPSVYAHTKEYKLLGKNGDSIWSIVTESIGSSIEERCKGSQYVSNRRLWYCNE